MFIINWKKELKNLIENKHYEDIMKFLEYTNQLLQSIQNKNAKNAKFYWNNPEEFNKVIKK